MRRASRNRIPALAALLSFGLAACSLAPASSPLSPEDTASVKPDSVSAPALPDLGPAPDFNSEPWLNTDAPITLASLHGKVVLVEFWTFG